MGTPISLASGTLFSLTRNARDFYWVAQSGRTRFALVDPSLAPVEMTKNRSLTAARLALEKTHCHSRWVQCRLGQFAATSLRSAPPPCQRRGLGRGWL